jgi:hypothetical protein
MHGPSGTLAPVPPHVPTDLVRDFSFYEVPGVADDVHLAWQALHEKPTWQRASSMG